MKDSVKQHIDQLDGELPLSIFSCNLKLDKNCEYSGGVIQYEHFDVLLNKLRTLKKIDFSSEKTSISEARDFVAKLMCILLQAHDVANNMDSNQSVLFSCLLRAKGCIPFEDVHPKFIGSQNNTGNYFITPFTIFARLTSKSFLSATLSQNFNCSANDLCDYLEEEKPFNGIGDGSVIGDWVDREIMFAKELAKETSIQK